jgi:hypothetical protein
VASPTFRPSVPQGNPLHTQVLGQDAPQESNSGMMRPPSAPVVTAAHSAHARSDGPVVSGAFRPAMPQVNPARGAASAVRVISQGRPAASASPAPVAEPLGSVHAPTPQIP